MSLSPQVELKDMIKSERQYRAATSALAAFERELAGRSPQPTAESEIHPVLWDIERSAIEGEIERLRMAIQEYDALKSGSRRVLHIRSWSDVPRALIEARIAADLTQRELAERLGVAEQQLQRYEATAYASASLTRLREAADALRVELRGFAVPADMIPSADRFFDRLADLGIDRKWLLDRLLPDTIAQALVSVTRRSKGAVTAALVQAADIVATVFDVSASALFGDQPIGSNRARVGATRYKRAGQPRGTRGSGKRDAYTSYVYFVAQQVVRGSEHLKPKPLPTSASALRDALLSRGASVQLADIIHFLWDHGIAVIPLSDVGRFYGACWRMDDGREVVVLKQRSHSIDRWLADLLHEIGHIIQEPGDKPFEILEAEVPSVTDARERSATEFAADVMFNGRAEALAEEALRIADGNIPFLKGVVPRVAAKEGVSPGALANYVAYYLARETNGRANWWGAAHALQETSADPWRVTRDALLEHVDFDAMPTTSRDVVIRALAEPMSQTLN